MCLAKERLASTQKLPAITRVAHIDNKKLKENPLNPLPSFDTSNMENNVDKTITERKNVSPHALTAFRFEGAAITPKIGIANINSAMIMNSPTIL